MFLERLHPLELYHPESPQERVFLRACRLIQDNPDKFGVRNVMNMYRTGISCHSTLVTQNDFHFDMFFSFVSPLDKLDEYSSSFELCLDHKPFYRLDASCNQENTELLQRLSAFTEEIKNKEGEGQAATILIEAMKRFSSEYGPHVTNFSDCYAETELPWENVETLLSLVTHLELPPLSVGEITWAEYCDMLHQHGSKDTSTLASVPLP